MASYDRVNWFRVPTSFDGQVMTIEHTPGMDSVYYAYFEPYSWERHLELLDRAQMSEHGAHARPGQHGRWPRPEPAGDRRSGRRSKRCGSSRASIRARRWPSGWSKACSMRCSIRPIAFGRQLLKEAVFYVVPNMNPDGSVRGNLRTNAAGANLNREWNTPSMERSPEVFLVKQKMKETGCDLFLDVHGDEGLPYVFVAGSDALPNFTPDQEAAQKQFIDDFKIASPDFQDEHGYPGRAVHRRSADHGFAAHHARFRLPVADAGDAVQGQRQRSGPAYRLGRRPQCRAWRGGAAASAAIAAGAAVI
jgi:murein tripeptide amidase MpaA